MRSLRGLIGQPDGGDRHDDEAALGDQERVLVGPVERAPVFHDPEPSGRDLVVDPVVEDDHAVRDVLLDPELGQVAQLAALAADHHRQAAVLEPAEQPIELPADDRLVGERAEQHLDRVQEDPFGADGLDRHREPDEQSFEVERTGLDDFARVQPEGVDREQTVPLELFQVEPERRDVGDQVALSLLEREEHARLAELASAADEELDPEQRLAGSGCAGDQRGPSLRKTTVGDLVEPGDAGGRLHQAGHPPGRIGRPERAGHVPPRAPLAQSLPREVSLGRLL